MACAVWSGAVAFHAELRALLSGQVLGRHARRLAADEPGPVVLSGSAAHAGGDDRQARLHDLAARRLGRIFVVDQTSTVVVRAPRMPALAGRYLYGDYCGGKIEAAAVDKGRVVASDDLGLVVPELSSFGVDGSGRIYGCRSRARSTVWIPSRPMSQRRARERSSAIQAATRSPIQIGVRST